jgi:hypothetical protein
MVTTVFVFLLHGVYYSEIRKVCSVSTAWNWNITVFCTVFSNLWVFFSDMTKVYILKEGLMLCEATWKVCSD